MLEPEPWQSRLTAVEEALSHPLCEVLPLGTKEDLLSELATIQKQVTTLSEHLVAMSLEQQQTLKLLGALSDMSLPLAMGLSNFFLLANIPTTPIPTTEPPPEQPPVQGESPLRVWD